LQNFLEEENERKIKVKAKLHVLKLKFKDRIKEHRISESSYLEDNGVVGNQKVLICHVPPGNPENQHPIKISYNAVHAHLNHGDYLGLCNGDMSDDINPPVIEILGENPASVNFDEPYNDEGATCIDPEDGDISDSIVTTGLPVVTNNPNELTASITYNCTDSSGNAASEVTRTVEIVDTMPPGGEQITIEVTESIGIGDTEIDVQK